MWEGLALGVGRLDPVEEPLTVGATEGETLPEGGTEGVVDGVHVGDAPKDRLLDFVTLGERLRVCDAAALIEGAGVGGE